MDNHSGENASQLVLDNRRLIIAFAFLIIICGSFFVIGYVEGKRQSLTRRSGQPAATGEIADTASAEPVEEKKAGVKPETAADKAVGEDLDWYQNVKRKATEPVQGLKPPAASGSNRAVAESPAGSNPSHDPAGKQAALKPSNAPQAQGKVTYSVQVGAFRHKKEAEAKAEVLKAKHYKYVIEPSGGTDSLFLLKVGRYESRADAVAMQLRLKRDGFVTFIKTVK